MEPSEIQSKKTAAGICAILIGSFGVHKFLLGYTNAGIITILVTVLTCGAAGVVMGIIGLVEGIIYLTMTDAQFYETYIANKKEWF
jgi:TM2 domain-containing membrane protein YozV